MPKETKKRQSNVHIVNLDTGWFSFQQLRDSGIAYLISIGVDTYAKPKEQEKMWSALLSQINLITKKEGYTDLFHTSSYEPYRIKYFTDSKWSIIKKKDIGYGTNLQSFTLFKDLSDIKTPTQSMASLLGDDIKQKVRAIISNSSIPKDTEIDKELEPEGRPFREQDGFRPRGGIAREMDEVAPAEPLPEGQINAPINRAAFINNEGRWVFDANLGAPRGRTRAAGGPENPQQVPRGALPNDWVIADDLGWNIPRVEEPPPLDRAQREAEFIERVRLQQAEIFNAPAPPRF